jgi:hypothetical protein
VPLRVTLWGQRAKDFSIDNVYNKDEAKPIVVLFVGCLAKHFQGLSLIDVKKDLRRIK